MLSKNLPSHKISDAEIIKYIICKVSNQECLLQIQSMKSISYQNCFLFSRKWKYRIYAIEILNINDIKKIEILFLYIDSIKSFSRPSLNEYINEKYIVHFH